MKKLLLVVVLFCAMLIVVSPVSASVINLLEAFDRVDDNQLKLGDGFSGTHPDDLDNDFGVNGVHAYRSDILGYFFLNNLSSDNAFSFNTVSSSVDTRHYFKINNNPTLYTLTNGTRTLSFNDSFNSIFNRGENSITFYIKNVGSNNLDDFFITKFDLCYNEAAAPEGSPVPEPATMLLLGSGLAGLFVSRKRKV